MSFSQSQQHVCIPSTYTCNIPVLVTADMTAHDSRAIQRKLRANTQLNINILCDFEWMSV